MFLLVKNLVFRVINIIVVFTKKGMLQCITTVCANFRKKNIGHTDYRIDKRTTIIILCVECLLPLTAHGVHRDLQTWLRSYWIRFGMLCSKANQIALYADWLMLLSSLDLAGMKVYISKIPHHRNCTTPTRISTSSQGWIGRHCDNCFRYWWWPTMVGSKC